MCSGVNSTATQGENMVKKMLLGLCSMFLVALVVLPVSLSNANASATGDTHPAASSNLISSVVSADGWGWQNPQPQGHDLADIWGSSSSDVFGVGWYGTILHYNGSTWSAMSSATTSELNCVWGTSSSDVFAVGWSGTILHYNGSTWSAMSSGTTTYLNTLNAVWGTSSSDVFAVGSDGTILHYNGSTWSAMSSGSKGYLTCVWGSSSSDVFAVGWSGKILHYDSSTWSAMSSGATTDLHAVWGTSSSNVFAVGNDGTILHYDGNAWTLMSSGTSGNLRGVWGNSGSDVFVVGASGITLHYDGSGWAVMASGTTNALYGIWGTSASDVFAVGRYGTILRYNGSAWRAMSSSVTTDWLSGIWGSSGSDIFATDGDWLPGTILHYNGSTWSVMNSGTECFLSGVWGTSATQVFAVGGTMNDDAILRYDGVSWTHMTSGATRWLWDVWGSSASDVFAVGEGGTILHYDGSTWSTMTSGTTEALYGVWGSSSSNVFAVGGTLDDATGESVSSTILHYNGSTWSTMSSGTTDILYGVWGSSPSDILAVGDDGTILHYNGVVWSTMSSSTNETLEAIWGASRSDVFAVGCYGTILHYDGSTWSAMNSGTRYFLWGVWGSSTSGVFVVGEYGTILHYSDAVPPAAVTDMDALSTTPNSVTLTWTSPGDNGDAGTASTYDIRYSTAAITEANWGSASRCTGEPAPQVAGSSETYSVTGLSPNTLYYFAVKTADEVPNWSALSNVVSFTTSAPPPDGWYEQFTSSNAGTYLYGQDWRCQTFTPSTSHNLNAVALYLYKQGAPDYTVTIGIYNAGANHKPTGSPLCTTTFAASSLTTTASWYTSTFSTGCPVSAGMEYAIVLLGSGGNTANRVVVRINTAGGYSRGMRGYSLNGGATWYVTSAQDMAFKEGQSPVSVPTWYEQFTTSNTGTYVYAQDWRCQTLTPSTSHNLNAVALYLYKQGAPDYTVAIGIYNVGANHKPTGSPLCTTTFAASSLSTTASWHTYRFSTGCRVSAAVEYAIVVSGDGGNSGNRVVVRVNTAGGYGGGVRGYSLNSGVTWYVSSAQDMAFKEGQT
jgi:hypothetical protein